MRHDETEAVRFLGSHRIQLWTGGMAGGRAGGRAEVRSGEGMGAEGRRVVGGSRTAASVSGG